MGKAIIVYESKYGNTRLVAETIAQSMKEASGVEVVLKEVKKVDRKELPGFDAILIGSPTHFGGPVGGAKRFINGLDKLQGKMVAVFDTYLGEKEFCNLS